MVTLIPALLTDSGIVPAAAAGLASSAFPVFVLAALLCAAAALLVIARTVDR